MVDYALMPVLLAVVRFGAAQTFGIDVSAALGNPALSAVR